LLAFAGVITAVSCAVSFDAIVSSVLSSLTPVTVVGATVIVIVPTVPVAALTVTVVVPVETPVTTPVPLTLAIPALPVVHVRALLVAFAGTI
jgi:hypothetical protein